MGHLNAKFFGDQISPKSRESIFSQLPVPGFFRFFFNDKQNEKAGHPTFGTATYLDYAFVLIKKHHSVEVWDRNQNGRRMGHAPEIYKHYGIGGKSCARNR